jgi:hypothetical protein
LEIQVRRYQWAFHMKIGRIVSVSTVVLSIWVSAALGSDASRNISAISIRPDGIQKFQLRSTDRLPDAEAEAKVERKGGTTAIEVHLDSLKPASLFGGDYNTYVLWVVPPDGPAENAGELQVDGDQSSLTTSTSAPTFALFVTAEPHYLVTIPSPFVVLETPPQPEAVNVRYRPLEGVYNFSRSSLADVKTAKGKVHTEVRQAFTAVRLAQRADAARLAPDALREAQTALDRTLELWHRRADRSEIAAQARTTVRLALAAQQLAENRAFHVRLEEEGSGGGNGEAGGRVPRAAK